MITVHEATLADVAGIRDVFQAAYGDDYAYPQYCDADALARLVFADGTLLLVAVDEASGRVAGTASVVFSVAPTTTWWASSDAWWCIPTFAIAGSASV